MKVEKLIAPKPKPKSPPPPPPPKTPTPPPPRSPTPPPPTPLPEYIAQFIGEGWFDKLFPEPSTKVCDIIYSFCCACMFSSCFYYYNKCFFFLDFSQATQRHKVYLCVIVSFDESS